MKRLLFLSVAALWGCDSFSPSESTDPLSEAVILEHLEFLAGDSLYGRAAGSTYGYQAAVYLRDEFSEYGLEPGVPEYFQGFSIAAATVAVAEQSRLSAINRQLPVLNGHPPTPGAQQAEMQLTAQNVLAVLPGRGNLVGQWLIVGAHYDHLGFVSWGADSVTIYNGADDNASGVSLLLEVARFLTHYYTAGVGADDARRSIMFQAYDAEERGLLGSRHYVQNPTVPMDSIVAMVNLDMVGRMRDNRVVVAGSLTASQWTDLLESANEDNLSLWSSDAGLSRSDQWPFLQQGKPVLYLSTGMHDDWHTPNDDVWLLDVSGMVKVGDLLLALLGTLAVQPAKPLYRWQ